MVSSLIARTCLVVALGVTAMGAGAQASPTMAAIRFLTDSNYLPKTLQVVVVRETGPAGQLRDTASRIADADGLEIVKAFGPGSRLMTAAEAFQCSGGVAPSCPRVPRGLPVVTMSEPYLCGFAYTEAQLAARGNDTTANCITLTLDEPAVAGRGGGYVVTLQIERRGAGWVVVRTLMRMHGGGDPHLRDAEPPGRT